MTTTTKADERSGVNPPAAVVPKAEESAARDAVVITVKEEPRADVAAEEFEKVCRICHLSPDRTAEEASELILIGCGCKNELGTAHRRCAETWFQLKGNRYCEICGLNAKNITGDEDGSFIEVWHATRAPSGIGHRNPPERAGCWRGQPFCNFLMACLVIAFILPWFFRVNMF